MIRLFILFVALLAWALDNTAQDFDDYQLLKSQGTIPSDFLLLSTEKFEVEKKEISKDEKRATRKSKEEFLLGSNYMVDRLLTSGRVLFNDPVSEYLNQILDKILESHPEHKGKIRVYAVKSSSVNAFATNNGIILVNLGLIAQLETEAQLAYILSHELIHYFNNHVMNVYLENEQIDRGKGSYQGSSLSEKIISSSNYSKEIESEADIEGFELFQKTQYSIESLGGVFDVLHYAYLPFDDIEFDKSFFETKHLVFPEDYLLEEVSPFSPFEEEDDSRSSHPSTYKRKLLLEKKLSDIGIKDGSNYIVSEERFEIIRKISRYELSNLYFNNEEYELAIYNSYMLLKNNPESKYLKKNICKALYSLVKYSNNNDFYQVHTRYKKTEGSSQQLYHLFEKMSRRDRNATALRYVWEVKNEYPGDEDLERIANDLITELAENHYEEGFFLERYPEVKASELEQNEKDELQLPVEEEKELSKYDKIRAQRKEDIAQIENSEFIRLAFVDLFEDDYDFKTSLNDAFAKAKEKVNLDNETRYRNRERKERQEEKEYRNRIKHGYQLGVDKTVVMSPFFMKLDLRKGEKVNYEQSETALLRFYDKIKWTANSLDLDLDILTISGLDSVQTERFNDIAFLSNWVDTRFSQIDQGIINMESNKLNELKEKYGTKYFCWTGVMNFRKSNSSQMYNLCLSLFMLPVPYVIYSMVKPNYKTYYYYIAFDMETGEPAMTIFNQFPQGDAQDYINTNIYDSLYQLKTKRRKED